MATTYYNLPTINGTDTIDGVNAINGLANAVDSALHEVESNASTVPGANSVNTSAIQNGAVTMEKIATEVFEGTIATGTGSVTSGICKWSIVHVPCIKMVNVKMDVNNLQMQTGSVQLTTLPAYMRPTNNFQVLAAVSPGTSAGVLFEAYVNINASTGAVTLKVSGPDSTTPPYSMTGPAFVPFIYDATPGTIS